MNSPFCPDPCRIQLAKISTLSLVFGMVFSQNTSGQTHIIADGGPIRVVSQNGQDFLQPRWSPRGDRLAVTGPNYEGLWVVDVGSGNSRQLTEEKAVGFGFSWSGDGDALVTRVARYDGITRRNAVKIFDADSGQVEQLTEYRTRMSTLPQWTIDDSSVLLPGDKSFEILQSGRAVSTGKNADDAPIFFAQDNVVSKADLRTGNIAPVSSPEAGAILNVVTSPDGSLVAYEVMGGDLMIAKTDGTNRISFGPGHRPRWSPDSRWIVYQVSEDDGHRFTGSDLYVARADGNFREQLTTTSDTMEMNPDWSPDGEHIAYDDRGQIFLLPVTEVAE